MARPAERRRLTCLGPGLSPAVPGIHLRASHLLGKLILCGSCTHQSCLSVYRMDDSYCLSALRSPFYPIPTPGSLPPLHPSAMHLHLSGVRYPPELSHSSLAALHSERMSSLSAER